MKKALLSLSFVVWSSQMSLGQAPELGQGWLPEFNLAARQLTAIAEAIPADKYNWRPGPGVRSTSELFMHVVIGNYGLLDQAKAKIPGDDVSVQADLEKKVTGKVEVISWLARSLEAVRKTYPVAERSKSVRFLGKDTSSDSVFLRILVHNHEHMGQAIAYARVLGVRPPWSK